MALEHRSSDLDLYRDVLAEAIHRYLALSPTYRICGEDCAPATYDLTRLPSGHLRFFSLSLPPMSIGRYLSRLVSYARCTTEPFLIALALITRLASDRYTARGGTVALPIVDQSIHRVYFAALVVGIKLHDDAFLTNAYYSQVGGVPLHELNTLELALLSTLGFDNLFVSAEEYAEISRDVWCCVHKRVPRGIPAAAAPSAATAGTEAASRQPQSATVSPSRGGAESVKAGCYAATAGTVAVTPLRGHDAGATGGYPAAGGSRAKACTSVRTSHVYPKLYRYGDDESNA